MSETRLQGMCKLLNVDKHMGRRYARTMCRLGDMYGKALWKEAREKGPVPRELKIRRRIRLAEQKKHIRLLYPEIIIVNAGGRP